MEFVVIVLVFRTSRSVFRCWSGTRLTPLCSVAILEANLDECGIPCSLHISHVMDVRDIWQAKFLAQAKY